jgi:hypothetical protein
MTKGSALASPKSYIAKLARSAQNLLGKIKTINLFGSNNRNLLKILITELIDLG